MSARRGETRNLVLRDGDVAGRDGRRVDADVGEERAAGRDHVVVRRAAALGDRVLAGDSYADHTRFGLGESIVVGASGAVLSVDEVGG